MQTNEIELPSTSLRAEFETINQKAWDILESDPPYALKLAEQALALAERLNVRAAAQRSIHVKGSVHRNTGDFAVATSLQTEAVRYAHACQDWLCKYQSLRELAILRHLSGDMQAALQYINAAIELAEHNELSTVLARITKGRIIGDNEQYEEALEYFLQLLPRAQAANNSVELASCYENIAGIYGRLDDMDQTIVFTRKALKIYHALDDEFGIMGCQIYLGNCAKLRGEYERAIDYFIYALNIGRKLGFNGIISVSLTSIGECEYSAGRKKQGIETIREAVEFASKNDNLNRRVQSLLTMGTLFLQERNFNDAFDCYQKTLDLAKRINVMSAVWQAHLGLAAIYEHCGDTEEAFKHHKEYAHIYKTHMGAQIQQRVANIMAQYERRQAQTTEKLLRLQAEQLKKESEQKNKELTNLALNLMQKRQGLQKLSAKLEDEAQTAKGQALKFTRYLIQNIKEQIDDPKEWDRFEQQFHTVYGRFMTQLMRRYPKISPMEAKICSLLKIDLSTKEIADVLCISLHTVNNHRQRIRKKLELKRSDNLVGTLTTI